MNKLCVIGDPVLHSKSPLIQNTMLRVLGLPYVYSAVPLPRGGLEDWLTRARQEGYTGFNATMPHKEALAKRVDVLSPEAAASGSVNTVCIRGDNLYGFSTDGAGFLSSLTDIGLNPAGKRVLLLGAGGAAKAVALALADAGAARVVLCNRSPEKARELCTLRQDRMCAAEWSSQALLEEAQICDVLVNSTSLGMTGASADFADFSFVAALPTHAAVCDLIYSPAETRLLAAARARGLTACNGLGMLIHQAICALEHFTDQTLDRALLLPAVRQALSEA